MKWIKPATWAVVTVLAVGGVGWFAWPKPVPVDPRNYRNYRRGDIIVSLAGVATNLALALIFTLAIAALGLLGRAAPAAGQTVGILQIMMIYGVAINLMLIVFNLMPIPPLDGSHVVKHMLPPRLAIRYEQLGRYGFLVLIQQVITPRNHIVERPVAWV